MLLYKKISKDIFNYLFGTDNFSYMTGSEKDFFYPIDLGFTLEDIKFYYHPLDDNGIPYKVYSSVGEQYNPTRIAAYGLSHYNQFLLTGDNESKLIFLKVSDWFYSFDSARYEYHFDWNDLKAPWISCMAQGEAVSVLVRAFKLTGEEKYLKHASRALESFKFPVNEGGVQSLIDEQYLFFEEYPSKSPDHVLNGFLYAVIGLIEFLSVKKDDALKLLLDELFSSLKANINRWGEGGWSYYQIPLSQSGFRNCCTPSYHNLQISQLKFVASKYSDGALDEIIRRWEKGGASLPVRLNALLCKVVYRVRNKAQR